MLTTAHLGSFNSLNLTKSIFSTKKDNFKRVQRNVTKD